MSYRRALLRRWSTQDWFAVITIALTVAFLTGAGLVVDATATRTTEIAAGQSSPASASWYEHPDAGRAAADADSLVLPVARGQIDGQTALVVGLPEDVSPVADQPGISLPDPPPTGELQHETATGTITVQGQSATLTATSRPIDRSILSPLWYQAQEDFVQRLGVTDTLVVNPANGGTPLTGALAFFVAGARSALSLFGLLAGGGAVLLGVVTFGITRVTVRERLQTIRTIRATGGTPRTILALFGLRAAVQTAVGVLVGYAVGIVLTNAAVSVAIFAGHPVALSTRVSSRLAIVLLPLYAGLIIVGGLGGLLAARQVATTPPLEISASTSPAVHDERNSVLAPISGHLSRFSPDLLGWRAVLPTAVTLAVFLAFAIAAFSTYGALAPLASGQDVAITESTATHPISSQVSVSYAAALEKQGIDASPEILLLAVTDGQPYVARGASFGAFASLAEAELVRGHPPANPSDAVIGSDLARTVDVSVGDTLTVGGSTQSAITRVHITGVFDAREPYDDQLITSLQTARHLSTVHPGEVNLIRVERLPDTSDRVSVLGIDAPGEVPADDSITMDVAVMNPTAVNQSRTVAVSFGDRTEAQRVTLPPGERQTVTFTFPTGSPREATIALDNTTQQVQVVAADALRIANLPTQAPPGSHPQITVTTISGEAVANAALTLGNETRRTDAAGTVRVPLQQEGVATLAIRKGTRRVNATVRVKKTHLGDCLAHFPSNHDGQQSSPHRRPICRCRTRGTSL